MLYADLFYEVIHCRLILWDVGFCRRHRLLNSAGERERES